MKAAQLIAYDGPAAITINEVDKPELRPNQVLVAVKAAAINPWDVKVSQGAVRQMIDMELPATLGGDVAGVVAEIGNEVQGFSVGQEVFGEANSVSRNGSFAEFTPVKATSLAAKPASVDFLQAAAFPLVAVSAYQALVIHANVGAGQKVLIHGAGGGIGSQAVQIAKQLGAYVAATAGSTDLNFVSELGADEVIDYKTQNFADLLHGYDVVFDTVGGETNDRSYTVLKPGGKLVSMVAEPNSELVEKYQVEAIHQSTQATTEILDKIRELIDGGKLKVNIDKIFPLDQTSEAMAYQAAGHVRGKVVLQIS